MPALTPLLFEPYLRPMVWGGRQLAERLGKKLPDGENYGESWEISSHSHHVSVVANGRHKGRSLTDLFAKSPSSFTGWPSPTFPWLFKFLDAHDWLSVQVHPNDDNAKTLWPGEGGKTEAWFVLDAAPGSKIFAGLQPGIDPVAFRRGIEAGRVEGLLHSFEPRPGDCIFLPAGTVHAVGGGILLAEIQQTSDATFRLFDWNRVDSQGRSRQLHLDEGMQAIDWTQGPVLPIRVEGYDQPAPVSITEPLVECPYFTMSFERNVQPFEIAGGTMQAFAVLAGALRWGRNKARAGDVVLLPASMKRTTFAPDPFCNGLLMTLPPLAA